MSSGNTTESGNFIPPDEVFEHFLVAAGLTLQLRRGPQGEPFGNCIIQYANADLEVSMVLDRGDRSVTIADRNTPIGVGVFLRGHPEYHATSISEFLFGVVAKPQHFEAQKAFVRANWDAILAMFNSENREATHKRLAELGRERTKRTFAPWPPVIRDFETFLQRMGLACKAREAPDGVLGERLMQYDSDSLSVKVASRNGWQLTIADKIGRPDTWYDIRTIRKALPGSADSKFPFLEWFPFAKANWNAILSMFNASERERTHIRLQPLEEENRRSIQLFLEKQKAQIDQIDKMMAAAKDAAKPK